MEEKKNKTIEIGKTYFDEIGPVVVLCFVDKNYLAAKRPRCKPFIMSLNEFSERFGV